MPSRRFVLAGLVALSATCLLVRPPLAWAGSDRVYNEGGLAIGGADPVAYFRDGRQISGSPDITLLWSGVTWRFASVEHRQAFEMNPRAYAPQYGGYCAYAVSQGHTAPVDPGTWQIVDGKLYLNLSAEVQARFNSDLAAHIAAADANWPKLRN